MRPTQGSKSQTVELVPKGTLSHHLFSSANIPGALVRVIVPDQLFLGTNILQYIVRLFVKKKKIQVK